MGLELQNGMDMCEKEGWEKPISCPGMDTKPSN